ncbi:hypothetical protein LINPERPRIM_LOCUS25440 [Linum perenne]
MLVPPEKKKKPESQNYWKRSSIKS